MSRPADLLPLVRELGDLKRVRSAGRAGSVAQRLFAAAWGALAAGQGVEEVARATTAAALAAARLGDLDAAAMAAVGIPGAEAQAILRAAVAEVSGPLDPALRGWLAAPPALAQNAPPPFVARLAAQPRAGATCPGRGRLMFEPPEDHAEHCLVTAVAGVVLSPCWGAAPATVFLAALAHHLHNALLPDSGFAGETLLGRWLEPAMESATTQALAELPDALRAATVQARAILPDAASAEGRAFHAADTLDRVLQMEHHLRAAGTTIGFLLREMELVHDGPVRPFQEGLLREVGLAA
ncbi:hypothetical protein ACI6QG_05235 [Roseococcus sp. DSY-14]|uniref:hypothetical protein n=1 Tax=Roseococcus sp. DSY-14 TaxID=3369650 RepID=UPI00387AD8A2